MSTNKLTTKILLSIIVSLILIIFLNSVIFYRNISTFTRRDTQTELQEKADDLSNYFKINIRTGEVTDRVLNVVELLDADIIVVSDTKRIIYNNTDYLSVKEVIDNVNIVVGHSELTNFKGESLGVIYVIEKDRKLTFLNNLFRKTIRNSIILGVAIVGIVGIILYTLLNRPLSKILTAMKNEELINRYKNGDWKDIIDIHNNGVETREKQKETQRYFFQNASHQLKSPLMNIQGYIEGSEDGIYSQEEANHLILNENERIKVLVEQMIRLSKAESREYSDFRYEDIDIKSFVEDIKTIVPKKIACTLDTNSKTFYFDRTVLEIIMSNLIQNASRYAKANINIKLDISDSIMLIVSDDGLGIDPQVKDTLFDRFTMGTGGKTGLGLSIVKEYVEATNGSISAFNDNGAVFKILWPNKKN